MRKVNRLPQPASLKENAQQWTKELLDEIKQQGSYTKADELYKNRYRQEDVKETLEKMYKRLYQYTFDWDNLHWCCEICNTSYKKAKWDFQYPILDPSKEDVDTFMQLDLTTGEYEAIEDNRRAQTTIDHTGLNRESLVKARRRIIIRFLKDYKAHQCCGDEKAFCREWELLKEDMDYPGLYEKLIKNVLERTSKKDNPHDARKD